MWLNQLAFFYLMWGHTNNRNIGDIGRQCNYDYKGNFTNNYDVKKRKK